MRRIFLTGNKFSEFFRKTILYRDFFHLSYRHSPALPAEARHSFGDHKRGAANIYKRNTAVCRGCLQSHGDGILYRVLDIEPGRIAAFRITKCSVSLKYIFRRIRPARLRRGEYPSGIFREKRHYGIEVLVRHNPIDDYQRSISSRRQIFLQLTEVIGQCWCIVTDVTDDIRMRREALPASVKIHSPSCMYQ